MTLHLAERYWRKKDLERLVSRIQQLIELGLDAESAERFAFEEMAAEAESAALSGRSVGRKKR